MRGDFRFQRGQTFPDFQGRRQLVVQMVDLRLEFAANGIDLVVKLLDLDFDARQSFPEIADARGDGFLDLICYPPAGEAALSLSYMRVIILMLFVTHHQLSWIRRWRIQSFFQSSFPEWLPSYLTQ